MRDGVEILGQVGIDHIRITLFQRLMDRLHCIRGASLGTIAIGFVHKLSLEDGFQHQHGGSLRHPVLNRRDTERSLASSGLGDHHPPDRVGSVRLVAQFLPEPRQPLLPPRRLDLLEAHPIHAAGSAVAFAQQIGVLQDVRPIDLVVEQVEAEGRLLLGLEIQLALQAPDLFRGLKAHVSQSPFDPRLLAKHTMKSGPFPPPGLAAWPVLWACPTPERSDAFCRRCPVRTTDRVSHVAYITFRTCRCHYPGGRIGLCGYHDRPAAALVLSVGTRRRVCTFEACSAFTRITARAVALPTESEFARSFDRRIAPFNRPVCY